MNKSDLVDYIAQDMETTKVEADKFVKAFTDAISKNLKKDGIKIAGFGTFGAKKRAAKMGRNPQTGEEMKIPAKWVPYFKPASALKEVAAKNKA